MSYVTMVHDRTRDHTVILTTDRPYVLIVQALKGSPFRTTELLRSLVQQAMLSGGQVVCGDVTMALEMQGEQEVVFAIRREEGGEEMLLQASFVRHVLQTSWVLAPPTQDETLLEKDLDTFLSNEFPS